MSPLTHGNNYFFPCVQKIPCSDLRQIKRQRIFPPSSTSEENASARETWEALCWRAHWSFLLCLVLHEWFQKLPPFTFRLTTFSPYHTCKRRIFSRTAHEGPVLLVVVEVE